MRDDLRRYEARENAGAATFTNFLDFRAGGFLSIFILFEKLNLNPHP
jgi:hypothetical protein